MLRACPFSAQMIQPAAVKCRFCQSAVTPLAAAAMSQRPVRDISSPVEGSQAILGSCLKLVGAATVSLVVCYLMVQPFLRGVFNVQVEREFVRTGVVGGDSSAQATLWSIPVFIALTLTGWFVLTRQE